MLGWFSSLFYNPPPKPFTPRSSTYDLQAMYEEIRQRYLQTDCKICWTPSRAKKFRSITFGTYNWRTNQIRINRILDDPEVPRYFVEFIVYHEMLHSVCEPIVDSAGRFRCHTAEFRRKEKQFPYFEAAKEWERKSLQFFKRKRSHGRA